MMRRVSMLLSAASIALAGHAFAAPGDECPAPAAPDVPDGANATMEEMVAAQKEMKAFMSDGDAYLKCLKKVDKGLPEDVDKEVRLELVSRHNDMVGSMETVAEEFNTAVRTFKENSSE